jgi:hypothetical protein
MMKSKWIVCLLAGLFLSASLLLAISAVPGAQPHDIEEDDEDAFDDPLPAWADLRVFILRPRTLTANRLGLCAATADENVDRYEFTPWYLPAAMTWSLNRSTVPRSVAGDVDRILQTSFDAWYSDVFVQGADTRVKRARLDKTNAILWKKLGRSTLGTTFVWYARDTGEVVEVDTVFNNRQPWAIFADSPECQTAPRAYDLQNIATHEFGHWVGLDDLYDSADKDLTMYGFAGGGEVKKRSLGTGDITGKNELNPFR